MVLQTTAADVGKRTITAAAALRPQLTHWLLILMPMLLMLLGSNCQMVQRNVPGQATGTITLLDLPGNATAAGHHPQPVYYLQERQASGVFVFYRLAFCAKMSTDDIPTGVPLVVAYDNITDGVMYSCTAPINSSTLEPSTELESRHRRVLLGESITTPRAPRILVYVTTCCGYAGGPSTMPEDYHHRIMLLPKSFSMKVPGLATLGRYLNASTAINKWGSALVWWNGDYATDLELLLHEIGHNYGMAHANVPGGCELRDQCDHTCTMGAVGGQAIRCLNAPHNWQVGWGRPFLRLGNSELSVGRAVATRIPPQLNTTDSSVMITGSGMHPNMKIFISARLNVYPYDLPWNFWEDSRRLLLIHTYDGTDKTPSAPTVLAAEIGVGETWRDPASRLVVRFDSWSNLTGAAVRICRRVFETEVNCRNGLDDDCDFLLDDEDPDCDVSYASMRDPSMRAPPMLSPRPRQSSPKPSPLPPTPNPPPPPLPSKPPPPAPRRAISPRTAPPPPRSPPVASGTPNPSQP
ncbi:hypothetical protein VOLCADRAFT_88037 [Volvox carteri f. nagariensis]|uniref:Peptidase M11 gametolysin domain-containing protein n=1 Tax=Volvox carteri f. nagariensis TaxID=3068 RepID=D8TMW9_VOLCA|nr:uncharacterized protein VOLCADRAFT_88037 [Volvox carteri f. nagariensis]EFJ51201.1 hypothetical protein VOLCADRAFT_88037 [Volvox carteri f. nagariensis]|eukprot:XP_002947668.1 hypothetical protein VOLCADRAFT_88037 [Volvox carteri f. nagariensis]